MRLLVSLIGESLDMCLRRFYQMQKWYAGTKLEEDIEDER